jgi:hypothetical protein
MWAAILFRKEERVLLSLISFGIEFQMLRHVRHTWNYFCGVPEVCKHACSQSATAYRWNVIMANDNNSKMAVLQKGENHYEKQREICEFKIKS